MEIFVILALVLAVILIIGYPLVNPARYRDLIERGRTSARYNDLCDARENVFEALRDLQFEYATGKLSTADYQQLDARYQTQAADVLRQIDALQAQTQNARVRRDCPRCHAAASASDKFCAQCGAKI